MSGKRRGRCYGGNSGKSSGIRAVKRKPTFKPRMLFFRIAECRSPEVLQMAEESRGYVNFVIPRFAGRGGTCGAAACHGSETRPFHHMTRTPDFLWQRRFTTTSASLKKYAFGESLHRDGTADYQTFPRPRAKSPPQRRLPELSPSIRWETSSRELCCGCSRNALRKKNRRAIHRAARSWASPTIN